MTPAVREIAAALRHAGIGEVDVSSRRRAEYSTDASLYRVRPTAVVFTQLHQLTGRRGVHLAELLASRLESGAVASARSR